MKYFYLAKYLVVGLPLTLDLIEFLLIVASFDTSFEDPVDEDEGMRLTVAEATAGRVPFKVELTVVLRIGPGVTGCLTLTGLAGSFTDLFTICPSGRDRLTSKGALYWKTIYLLCSYGYTLFSKNYI